MSTTAQAAHRCPSYPCPICDAHTAQRFPASGAMGAQPTTVPCKACNGTGKQADTAEYTGYKPCPGCKGAGLHRKVLLGACRLIDCAQRARV